MSAITPQTYIKLVHFEANKQHQLTFETSASQFEFFQNMDGLEISACTYQREQNKIRFPAVIDALEKYNYVIYRNLPYNYKFYYAYITKMEYVSDEMTDVYIELDVFQTWQFNFIYKPMFIEREHVENDTVGLHTVPEGLETGDFILNSTEGFPDYNEKLFMVRVTEDTSQNVQSGTILRKCFFFRWLYIMSLFHGRFNINSRIR